MRGQDMNSFNLIAPPSEKIAGGFQQAGKKEGTMRGKAAWSARSGNPKD